MSVSPLCARISNKPHASELPTFELFVFDLLVDLGDEALNAVVFAVWNEVGEADWRLAMRMHPRNQPQPTRHA